MEIIKQFILKNNFSEVYNLILKDYNLLDKIELLTYETPNKNIFDFICYLGDNSKEEKILSFASMILATSLCHIDNAYQKAYFYAQKAVSIEPNNLQNLEWLLFFYDIPDKIMSEDELKFVIEQILEIEHNHKKAIDYLKLLSKN